MVLLPALSLIQPAGQLATRNLMPAWFSTKACDLAEDGLFHLTSSFSTVMESAGKV